MDKLKKQTELNTSNENNSNEQSSDLKEFNKLKEQLISINEDYFSNAINSIENELMVDHLYASGALENEERLNLFRREMMMISDELSEIKKSNLNDKNAIFTKNDTTTMDLILEDLKKLQAKTYLSDLRNKIEDSVEATTNNVFNSSRELDGIKKTAYKDSILGVGDDRDERFITDSKNQIKKNYTLLKEIKTKLLLKKVHWAWYIIVISILFVGLILAIVLPIVL